MIIKIIKAWSHYYVYLTLEISSFINRDVKNGVHLRRIIINNKLFTYPRW